MHNLNKHQPNTLFIVLLLSILPWAASQARANGQTYQPPFVFWENLGQVKDQCQQPRPEVLYSLSDGGLVCHFKADGLHYQLSQAAAGAGPADEQLAETQIYRVDLSWIGANPAPRIQPGAPAPARRYFSLAGEVQQALGYQSLTYYDLYPGIDLHCYQGPHGGLEYDFIVHPGADYRQIRVRIEGAELSVDEAQRLLLHTPLGTIAEGSLHVHQAGQPIAASWIVEGQQARFSVADGYDPSQALVIDPPVRVWGTYYASRNTPLDAVTDEQGNLYLTGFTTADELIATTGAHLETRPGGGTIFLAKFSPQGQLLWGTYYGGSSNEWGYGCAVDSERGLVYITGYTRSSDFPSTPGAHSTNFGQEATAFLTQFDTEGQLRWSTFYGIQDTQAWACALDPQGNAYITGNTKDPNTIATPGAHLSQWPGNSTGFAVKFSPSGQRLWGTYYGGDGITNLRGAAVDGGGNLYISGRTASRSGIATPGTQEDSVPDSLSVNRAFLAKLDPNGQRVWGTYFGGNEPSSFSQCRADISGNVYLIGFAAADSLGTPGSYMETFSSSTKGYFAKFNSDGQRVWGSYFDSTIENIALSKTGEIGLVGLTPNPMGIITPDAHQDSLIGERTPYFARFDNDGQLLWGTYYGGESGRDWGTACAFSPEGAAYMLGYAFSQARIASEGSYQEFIPPIAPGISNRSAFIVKFSCSSSSLNVTACGSYALNGQAYEVSGSYRQLLADVNGCDSLVLLELEVIPALEGPNFFASICEGQAFPFGNNLYDSPGVYFDTLTSLVTGCDSIRTMTLLLLPSMGDTLRVTACQEYSLDGQSYTESGQYSLPFVNSFGCPDSRLLDLEIVPFWETALYDTICLGNAYTLNGSTYESPGTYVQNLASSTLGCDSIVTLHLSVSEALPSLALEAQPATCPEQADGQASVSATGSPPFAYAWGNGQTGPVLSGLSSGSYPLTVTDRHGCTATAEVAIGNAYVLGNAFATIAPPACAGESNGALGAVPQGGLPPYDYQWSNGAAGPNLAQIPAGLYSLTLTDANGCRAVDSIALAEPPLLSLGIDSIAAACPLGAAGSAVGSPSGGSPPYSYTWSGGQTGQSATGLPPGPFDLIVTDANGCTADAAATVPAHPAPLAELETAQLPTCDLASDGSLAASAAEGLPPYAYAWSDGQSAPTAIGLAPGTYRLTLTDANGCLAMAEALLPADVYAPNDSIRLEDGTLTSLEATASYQWIDCDSGLPVPGAEQQAFAPAVSGNYAVVLSQGPCRDTTACVSVVLSSSHKPSGAPPSAALFPNPNGGTFFLELPAAARLQLYDARGRRLLQQDYGPGLHQLSPALPAGAYLLRLEGRDWQQLMWMLRQD